MSLSALLDCADMPNGAKWTRICRNPTAVAGMRVNDQGLALRVEGNVEAKSDPYPPFGLRYRSPASLGHALRYPRANGV